MPSLRSCEISSNSHPTAPVASQTASSVRRGSRSPRQAIRTRYPTTTIGVHGQLRSTVPAAPISAKAPATSAAATIHHAWSGRVRASSSGTVWAVASAPASAPFSR